MCPQNNPYMVKTQTGVQRKGVQRKIPKDPNSIVVEDSEDSHGSDVSSDVDNQEWIYYELNKSCDDGFWHDTANTIVSEHLSNNQQARLQKFVLTIAKRIFMFASLKNPSFKYNLKKGSHVMQVEDKYHVIVRREQNIVHIFACTAKQDNSYVYSFGGEIKKSTRKDALGIQNDPSRLSSNRDEHNSARSLQHETDDESIDPESTFVKRIQDAEERQAASRLAAEARAAADSRRGRPQNRINSTGPVGPKARSDAMFVHDERHAVQQVQGKAEARRLEEPAQEVRQVQGEAAAQGGVAANISPAPKVPAPAVPAPAQPVQEGAAPKGADLGGAAAKGEERVPAAKGGAAAKGAAQGGTQQRGRTLPPRQTQNFRAFMRRDDSEDDQGRRDDSEDDLRD
jgi:hypothetical protein